MSCYACFTLRNDGALVGVDFFSFDFENRVPLIVLRRIFSILLFVDFVYDSLITFERPLDLLRLHRLVMLNVKRRSRFHA